MALNPKWTSGHGVSGDLLDDDREGDDDEDGNIEEEWSDDDNGFKTGEDEEEIDGAIQFDAGDLLGKLLAFITQVSSLYHV